MHKAEIIAQLRRDLHSLTGTKPQSTPVDVGIGPIASAFPNNCFPTGAMHEFLSDAAEDAAATYGFISAALGPIMRLGGTCIWIRTGNQVFPPALTVFGIKPDQVIFIDQKNKRETLWAAEECLKCTGLAGVVFEAPDISLVASRRLQLAVEKSNVTGFIIRYKPRELNPIASIAQWRIKAEASTLHDGIPGLGFPRWQVELIRVRNGRPGKWVMEYVDGHMTSIQETIPLVQESVEVRKIG